MEVVVHLAVAAALAAQIVPAAPPPVPRVIALDEALAAAESVPEVVAARASERIASAGERDARAPGEPSLTMATRSVSARESLGVSVPFRWGGQRSSAVTAAQAEMEVALRLRTAAIAAARRACRVAWFTLAGREDLLRAATGVAERAERNRRAVADLLELQRASKLDASRAEAEAARAAAARGTAEQLVIAASAELRALLGVEDGRLSAGDQRPTPSPEGTFDDWRERGRSASPDLKLAEAEARAAEARATRRARDNRPATALQAGADWNDPTQPGTDALLGLAITFPTRGRAAVDAARAEQDRANALLELARRRVDADLETAWSATAAARLRYESVDARERPAASEAAELTRVAYTEGKLDLFRLLDAERALAEAEREHADAYREWGTAYAELERLAPVDTP